MLEWMTRDGKLVLVSKTLRRFSYGYLGVTAAIYLGIIGFNGFTIGLILTTAVLGGAVLTLVASFLEARVGRRRLLLIFSIMMGAAGVAFSISTDFFVLMIATLLGTMNVTGNEFGAFLSLEQSIIPQTVATNRVTFAYALYNIGGSLAGSAGALLGFLPGFFQERFGMSVAASFKPMFIGYVFIAMLVFVTYALLSKKVETVTKSREESSLTPVTRKRVVEMSGFFAFDAFGGGILVQSFVAYWFFTRFNAPLDQISIVFSVAGVLTAISFLVSARLSDLVGPLKTMCFIHVPADGALLMVPLFPDFLTAMAFYLVFISVSQMDVAPRQAYIVSMVRPEEMVASASATNISRNLAQIAGPTASGYLIQYVSISSPFFIGGGIRLVSALSLYFRFRKVPVRAWESRIRPKVDPSVPDDF